MKNELPTVLSDDELFQVSGGKSQREKDLPQISPPRCFSGKARKKRTKALLIAAECASGTDCPYYEDCKNPDKRNALFGDTLLVEL